MSEMECRFNLHRMANVYLNICTYIYVHIDMLGNWVSKIDELADIFSKEEPYPHVVIDDFFSEKFVNELSINFSPVDDTWYKYWNPIEKKYAKNNFSDNPTYKILFDYLQTSEFISIIRKITSILDLQNDPYLHGAGIHYYPIGGKLDMHLDYSIHPISGMERRVNLIIYLNDNISDLIGGDLELWDKDFITAVKKIKPIFNRAVLFQTSDISYHGLPTPIKSLSLSNTGRKSIAIYYISNPRIDAVKRYKAFFRPLPTQICNNKLNKLYEIRGNRLITSADLEEFYPDWESDSMGIGYWN